MHPELSSCAKAKIKTHYVLSFIINSNSAWCMFIHEWQDHPISTGLRSASLGVFSKKWIDVQLKPYVILSFGKQGGYKWLETVAEGKMKGLCNYAGRFQYAWR